MNGTTKWLKDRRLTARMLALVRRHCDAVPRGAAGSSSLPSAVSSFAETMAAWRFYNNPRIEMSELIEPLREYARQQLVAADARVVMLVHDWSKLSYKGHSSKKDQAQMAQTNSHGYELTSVLAVNGTTGDPLAPMEVHLKTADGVLSTRNPAPADVHHLEQVLPTMQASRTWNLNCPTLHVIDCEADSIGHFRAWHAGGHQILVRGQDHRIVTWEGRKLSRKTVGVELKQRGEFQHCGEALYHGEVAKLWVAETEVVLTQPARTMVLIGKGKKQKKKQVSIPGPPLTLRLIVVQVRHPDGPVLATWHLFSNAPKTLLTAEQLARCYYWRWRIESYFKLLKSHGQQLEHWLQETGEAIFRRLLVATMACMTVWHLEADKSPDAIELKNTLMRFSGRQTKRSRPHTAPALLAGLWCVLTMLEYLENHDLDELKKLVQNVTLPFPIFKDG
jgi:Transposase DDE domain/Transposase DNA-binding